MVLRRRVRVNRSTGQRYKYPYPIYYRPDRRWVRVSRVIKRSVLTATLTTTVKSTTQPHSTTDTVDGSQRFSRGTERQRLTGLLAAAARHQDPEALRCLVEQHQADPDTELVQLPAAFRRRRTRPLHIAVTAGRAGLLDRVQILLTGGADANARDGRGNTALHLAAAASEAPASRLLLSHGADPDMVDHRGETALHCAARQGHCQMVRALLTHGADQFIADRAGLLPVHVAASAGNYHIVQMLCKADRRAAEAGTKRGNRRPLQLAATGGHAETVALLTDRLHADVFTRDSEANTALHAVVLQPQRTDGSARESGCFYACAAELLRRGAPVDARNAAHQTPLALAAANQYPKIAQLLLSAGARPLTTDVHETVPPSKQRRLADKNVVDALVEDESSPEHLHRKKPSASSEQSATSEEQQKRTAARKDETRNRTEEQKKPSAVISAPSQPSIQSETARQTSKEDQDRQRQEDFRSLLRSKPSIDNEISTFSVTQKGGGERMCILLDKRSSQQDQEERVRSRRSIEGEMNRIAAATQHLKHGETPASSGRKLVAIDIDTGESAESKKLTDVQSDRMPTKDTRPEKTVKETTRSGKRKDTATEDERKKSEKLRKEHDRLPEAASASTLPKQSQKTDPHLDTVHSATLPKKDLSSKSPAEDIFYDPEHEAQKWFDRPGAASPVALKDVRKFSTPTFRSASKSPAGFISEGGGMRGLGLKVAGVVPKAYNRRQKEAARRAFFAARPVGIESVADDDLDEMSLVSMSSMPEVSYDVWEKMMQRRKEWSEPLRPIYGKPPRPSGGHLNVSFHSSVGSPAPSDDKLLIGPYAPSYKSFGPIDVKTDLIEEAMQDYDLSYEYDSREWNDDDMPEPLFDEGEMDSMEKSGICPPPEILDRNQAVEELLRKSPPTAERKSRESPKVAQEKTKVPSKTSLPEEKIRKDRQRMAEMDREFEAAKKKLSQKLPTKADKRGDRDQQPVETKETLTGDVKMTRDKGRPEAKQDSVMKKVQRDVITREEESHTVVHSSVVSSHSSSSTVQRLTEENYIYTVEGSTTSESDDEDRSAEEQLKVPQQVPPSETRTTPVKGILKTSSKYSSQVDKKQPGAGKEPQKEPTLRRQPDKDAKSDTDRTRPDETSQSQPTARPKERHVDREPSERARKTEPSSDTQASEDKKAGRSSARRSQTSSKETPAKPAEQAAAAKTKPDEAAPSVEAHHEEPGAVRRKTSAKDHDRQPQQTGASRDVPFSRIPTVERRTDKTKNREADRTAPAQPAAKQTTAGELHANVEKRPSDDVKQESLSGRDRRTDKQRSREAQQPSASVPPADTQTSQLSASVQKRQSSRRKPADDVSSESPHSKEHQKPSSKDSARRSTHAAESQQPVSKPAQQQSATDDTREKSGRDRKSESTSTGVIESQSSRQPLPSASQQKKDTKSASDDETTEIQAYADEPGSRRHRTSDASKTQRSESNKLDRQKTARKDSDKRHSAEAESSKVPVRKLDNAQARVAAAYFPVEEKQQTTTVEEKAPSAATKQPATADDRKHRNRKSQADEDGSNLQSYSEEPASQRRKPSDRRRQDAASTGTDHPLKVGKTDSGTSDAQHDRKPSSRESSQRKPAEKAQTSKNQDKDATKPTVEPEAETTAIDDLEQYVQEPGSRKQSRRPHSEHSGTTKTKRRTMEAFEQSSSRTERLGETVRASTDQSTNAPITATSDTQKPETETEMMSDTVRDLESYVEEPGSKKKQRRGKPAQQEVKPTKVDEKHKKREDDRQQEPAVKDSLSKEGQTKSTEQKPQRDLLPQFPKGKSIRPDVWQEAMNDKPLACSDVMYDDVVIPNEEMVFERTSQDTSTMPVIQPSGKGKSSVRKPLKPRHERLKPKVPNLQVVKETSVDDDAEIASSDESSASSTDKDQTEISQGATDAQRIPTADKRFQEQQHDVEHDLTMSTESESSEEDSQQKLAPVEHKVSDESQDSSDSFSSGEEQETTSTPRKTKDKMEKETDIDADMYLPDEPSGDTKVQKKRDVKETNIDEDIEEDLTEESLEESSEESDTSSVKSAKEPSSHTAHIAAPAAAAKPSTQSIESREADTGSKLETAARGRSSQEKDKHAAVEKSVPATSSQDATPNEIAVTTPVKETSIDKTTSSEETSSESEDDVEEIEQQENANKVHVKDPKAKDSRQFPQHDKQKSGSPERGKKSEVKEHAAEDELSDYDIPIPGAENKPAAMSPVDARAKQVSPGKPVKETNIDDETSSEEASSEEEEETKRIKKLPHKDLKLADIRRVPGDQKSSRQQSHRPPRPSLKQEHNDQQQAAAQQVKQLLPKALEDPRTSAPSVDKKRQNRKKVATYHVQEAEREYERKHREQDACSPDTKEAEEELQPRKPSTLQETAEKTVLLKKAADVKQEEFSSDEWTSDDEPELKDTKPIPSAAVKPVKDLKHHSVTAISGEKFHEGRSRETAIDDDLELGTEVNTRGRETPEADSNAVQSQRSYQETSFDEFEPNVDLDTCAPKKEVKKDRSRRQQKPGETPPSENKTKERGNNEPEFGDEEEDEEFLKLRQVIRIGKGRVKKAAQRKRLSDSLFVDPNATKKLAGEKEGLSDTAKTSVDQKPSDGETSVTDRVVEIQEVSETNIDDDLTDVSSTEETGEDDFMIPQSDKAAELAKPGSKSEKQPADTRRKVRERKTKERPGTSTAQEGNRLMFASVGDKPKEGLSESDNDSEYKAAAVRVPQQPLKYQPACEYEEDQSDVEQSDDDNQVIVMHKKADVASKDVGKMKQQEGPIAKRKSRSRDPKPPEQSAVAEIKSPVSSGEDDRLREPVSQPPNVPQLRLVVQETNFDEDDDDIRRDKLMEQERAAEKQPADLRRKERKRKEQPATSTTGEGNRLLFASVGDKPKDEKSESDNDSEYNKGATVKVSQQKYQPARDSETDESDAQQSDEDSQVTSQVLVVPKKTLDVKADTTTKSVSKTRQAEDKEKRKSRSRDSKIHEKSDSLSEVTKTKLPGSSDEENRRFEPTSQPPTIPLLSPATQETNIDEDDDEISPAEKQPADLRRKVKERKRKEQLATGTTGESNRLLFASVEDKPKDEKSESDNDSEYNKSATIKVSQQKYQPARDSATDESDAQQSDEDSQVTSQVLVVPKKTLDVKTDTTTKSVSKTRQAEDKEAKRKSRSRDSKIREKSDNLSEVTKTKLPSSSDEENRGFEPTSQPPTMPQLRPAIQETIVDEDDDEISPAEKQPADLRRAKERKRKVQPATGTTGEGNRLLFASDRPKDSLSESDNDSEYKAAAVKVPQQPLKYQPAREYEEDQSDVEQSDEDSQVIVMHKKTDIDEIQQQQDKLVKQKSKSRDSKRPETSEAGKIKSPVRSEEEARWREPVSQPPSISQLRPDVQETNLDDEDDEISPEEFAAAVEEENLEYPQKPMVVAEEVSTTVMEEFSRIDRGRTSRGRNKRHERRSVPDETKRPTLPLATQLDEPPDVNGNASSDEEQMMKIPQVPDTRFSSRYATEELSSPSEEEGDTRTFREQWDQQQSMTKKLFVNGEVKVTRKREEEDVSCPSDDSVAEDWRRRSGHIPDERSSRPVESSTGRDRKEPRQDGRHHGVDSSHPRHDRRPRTDRDDDQTTTTTTTVTTTTDTMTTRRSREVSRRSTSEPDTERRRPRARSSEGGTGGRELGEDNGGETEPVQRRHRRGRRRPCSVSFGSRFIVSYDNPVELKPMTVPRPKLTLEQAAMQAVTNRVATQPRLHVRKLPEEPQIVYTRGIYRPQPVYWRGTSDTQGFSFLHDSRDNTLDDSVGGLEIEEDGPLPEKPVEALSTPADLNKSTGSTPGSEHKSAFAPVGSQRYGSHRGLRSLRRSRRYVTGPAMHEPVQRGPLISEPGPVDFRQYGAVARMWMEQVDMQTVRKSKTMYMSVMPAGSRPPQQLLRSLKYDVPDNDVYLPQWIMVRERSLRRLRERQRTSTQADDLDTSTSGPMSPGRRMMLFFQVGERWKELAWALFAGIHSDAETLRMITDIELKFPEDLSEQIQQMMSRWWKRKGSNATVTELRDALDLIGVPYVSEQAATDARPSFSTSFVFDSDQEELDIGEVTGNDPNVSRLMDSYRHQSFTADSSASPPRRQYPRTSSMEDARRLAGRSKQTSSSVVRGSSTLPAVRNGGVDVSVSGDSFTNSPGENKRHRKAAARRPPVTEELSHESYL